MEVSQRIPEKITQELLHETVYWIYKPNFCKAGKFPMCHNPFLLSLWGVSKGVVLDVGCTLQQRRIRMNADTGS